jgi:hypothetical protein
LEKELQADMPADRKLEMFYRTLYHNLEKYAREMAEVPAIVSSHSPHGQPMVCRIREIFIEKLDQILQSGVTEGSFSKAHNNGMLQTIIEMTGFINLDWIKETPKKNRDQIIDYTIGIILNGIRKN